MKNIIQKVMYFWEIYYPVVLAFLSFLYSVTLWFSGSKLEGIFVGIWVPSILAASVAIRQRRNDSIRTRVAQEYYHTKKVKIKRTKK